jgi:hypothetical protein
MAIIEWVDQPTEDTLVTTAAPEGAAAVEKAE